MRGASGNQVSGRTNSLFAPGRVTWLLPLGYTLLAAGTGRTEQNGQLQWAWMMRPGTDGGSTLVALGIALGGSLCLVVRPPRQRAEDLP